MKVIILGGGASGLMLASQLQNSKIDIDYLVLEKSTHVGKKILVSGNGKCNLSNTNITENCYNNLFGYQIATKQNVLKAFHNMGLITNIDEQGRVYPYSLMANTVLDLLRVNIKDEHIQTSTNIIKIRRNNNQFILTSDQNKTYIADILIIATGGKTYYKDSNSYILATMLSHRVTTLRPTLLPLKVSENLSPIENLRSKVKAQLITNQKVIFEDSGEVLYKKDALSGIVMFVMSSIIARNPNIKYQISLDLAPQISEEELKKYIENFPTLEGMFPKMIAQYVLKQCKTNTSLEIAKKVKNLTFNVLENIDFKNAQVTSGGVDVLELNENLQSKIVPNLYFSGEIVDVDGLCGGYNLHFAFASAMLIANDIIRKLEQSDE